MPSRTPQSFIQPFITMSGSPHHDFMDDDDASSDVPLNTTISLSPTTSDINLSRTSDTPRGAEVRVDGNVGENGLEDGEIVEHNPPLTLDQNQGEDAIAAAFLRRFPWIREVDAFDPNLTWKPAEWYIANRDPNALALDDSTPEPAAIAFLQSLISIDLDELSLEDRNCSICTDPYLSGELPEIPLQLPCGHTFGKECLFQWMSQIGSATHTNCPVCRSVHVRKRSPINTLEGLAQLLQQADWMLNRMGPLRLDAEGRKRWQSVKEYVNEHLAEQEARRQNEMRLRWHMHHEMHESRTLRRLNRFLTPEEREDLHERITAAIVGWNAWRRPNADWDEVDDVIVEIMEEEQRASRMMRARREDGPRSDTRSINEGALRERTDSLDAMGLGEEDEAWDWP